MWHCLPPSCSIAPVPTPLSAPAFHSLWCGCFGHSFVTYTEHNACNQAPYTAPYTQRSSPALQCSRGPGCNFKTPSLAFLAKQSTSTAEPHCGVSVGLGSWSVQFLVGVGYLHGAHPNFLRAIYGGHSTTCSGRTAVTWTYCWAAASSVRHYSSLPLCGVGLDMLIMQ